MKLSIIRLLLSTLIIVLLSTGCSNNLRKEWRESVKNKQKSQKENLTGEVPQLTLEEQLAEIDASLQVKTIKKNIARYEKQLQKAHTSLYDKSQAMRALGLIYLNNQLYLAALEQFEQALNITPQNAMLHYYAGISSGWMSNLEANSTKRTQYKEQALFHLERASEINPNHAETALALATLYTEQEKLSQAQFQLKRYKSMRPHSLDAMLLEASIATKQKQFALARELYQKIIQESQQSALKEQAQRALDLLP
ncbi:tetratricopeptide repeat protein [Entomospira entomophila]|uniref:Tetratricopeptide repeat protein n=1 Tax=Entomospira entomophila TaxID=2719988 RepID=A0A968G7E1_9SPIO|nr:tetratricopeptide repeat protein [Entomospira entomophilus]NIZ39980.1 tetratricopeptide repeat protein [Entomospira entomophilus]WDI35540.1 tetratricopeptide repeat protein [Entomospira entomophilus]